MRTPNLLFALLLFLLASGISFADIDMNSTNYGMELVMIDGGGQLDANSTNYRMDVTVGLIAGYANSSTYSTYLGLFLFPSNNTVVINITVNSTIIYPPNNSLFGPGVCNILTQLRSTDNAALNAIRSSTCQLYLFNGSAFLLNQTLSSASSSADYNFTTAVSGNNFYEVNCTATVSGVSNNTMIYDVTLIGQSFCSGGANDDNPGWGMIGSFITGGIMILVGLIWMA